MVEATKVEKVGEFVIGYPIPFSAVFSDRKSVRRGHAFVELYRVPVGGREVYAAVVTSSPKILKEKGVNEGGSSLVNGIEHFASFFHMVLENEGISVRPEDLFFIEYEPDEGNVPQSLDLCVMQPVMVFLPNGTKYWDYTRSMPDWFILWEASSINEKVSIEKILQERLPEVVRNLR